MSDVASGNAPPLPQPLTIRTLSFDSLKQACKNIGFDLSCGACAEVFFTGSGGHAHDDSCSTHSEARSYAEVIDSIREELGQDVTHYFVIAGDVKELVEAVERQDGSAFQVLQKLRERGHGECAIGSSEPLPAEESEGTP